MRAESAPFTSGRSPAHTPVTSSRVIVVVSAWLRAREHVLEVGVVGLRVVERAVEVGVGGADVAVLERAVGQLAPRHDEQAALVAGHRR